MVFTVDFARRRFSVFQMPEIAPRDFLENAEGLLAPRKLI